MVLKYFKDGKINYSLKILHITYNVLQCIHVRSPNHIYIFMVDILLQSRPSHGSILLLLLLYEPWRKLCPLS